MARAFMSTPSAEHGDAVEMADQTRLAARSATATTAKEVRSATEVVNTPDEESLEDQDGTLHATKSTACDAAGMRRMGKDQELIRQFRLLSITSFVAIATAAWEIGLFIITPGLVDGGRAGLVWNTVWNFIGFAPVYLSMAEMVSTRSDERERMSIT